MTGIYSHNSGGWEVQDQCTDRSGIYREPPSLCILICLLGTAERERENEREREKERERERDLVSFSFYKVTNFILVVFSLMSLLPPKGLIAKYQHIGN